MLNHWAICWPASLFMKILTYVCARTGEVRRGERGTVPQADVSQFLERPLFPSPNGCLSSFPSWQRTFWRMHYAPNICIIEKSTVNGNSSKWSQDAERLLSVNRLNCYFFLPKEETSGRRSSWRLADSSLLFPQVISVMLRRLRGWGVCLWVFINLFTFLNLLKEQWYQGLRDGGWLFVCLFSHWNAELQAEVFATDEKLFYFKILQRHRHFQMWQELNLSPTLSSG